MRRALYAPMRVLWLADKKNAMDKLFYYVSQTDRMLPKYLGGFEERLVSLLLDATINAINTSTFSAGVSDDDSDSSNEDDNDDESDGDDPESVEGEDSGEDGDDVQ